MNRTHRLLRAWAVAVTATGLGATSHTLAGGELPHPLIFALATSLAALLTLGLTRLKASQLSLGAGVLTGQGLLHLLYSHGSTVLVESGHHHAHSLSVIARGQTQSYGAEMWAGHGLAAAATYGVLAYGEHLLGALIALARIGVSGLLPPLSAAPLPHRLRFPARFVPPVWAPLAHLTAVLTTRGPPAILAAPHNL